MAHILCVDNDPDYRRQLAFALEWSDHTVTDEPSGKDAVARVREESFDVVILAIFMPEMDGFELIKEIRSISPHPKIIALSSNGQYRNHTYVAAVAKALGAAAVVDKASSVPELNKVIAEVLE